jgi:hypothetical protein
MGNFVKIIIPSDARSELYELEGEWRDILHGVRSTIIEHPELPIGTPVSIAPEFRGLLVSRGFPFTDLR